MQPHTASERLPSMTTVLSMRQRNTSPASNTKHDEDGILYLGVEQFLLDEGAIDL